MEDHSVLETRVAHAHNRPPNWMKAREEKRREETEGRVRMPRLEKKQSKSQYKKRRKTAISNNRDLQNTSFFFAQF